MKIINLQPEITTLTKQGENVYTLDWGIIKKGSESNRQLTVEDFQKQRSVVKTSCGGCTKAKIVSPNTLNINYDTNLLGRILKNVYIFDGEEKVTIKMIGKIEN